MPRVDLNAKPICITGASAGIGRATAIACAAAGMPVVLAARRLDKLEALAETIAAAGGRALPVEVDVNDADACAEMVARCIEAYGSIYSVFANAGYGIDGPTHELLLRGEEGERALRDIMETNFWGTINTIRPAIKPMLDAAGGHILICSSSIGRLTMPNHGIYCATKAAQLHIGRAMNMELRGAGVRVSTVHPIGTRTEFFDVMRREHTPDAQRRSNTPSFFMQPPERVANAVVKCLRRPRPEVWTSLTVRAAAAAATLCPPLLEFAMRKR